MNETFQPISSNLVLLVITAEALSLVVGDEISTSVSILLSSIASSSENSSRIALIMHWGNGKCKHAFIVAIITICLS